MAEKDGFGCTAAFFAAQEGGLCSSPDAAFLRHLRNTSERGAGMASSSGGAEASAGRSSAMAAAIAEESEEGEVRKCVWSRELSRDKGVRIP